MRNKDNTLSAESQGYILLHRQIFENKYYFSQKFTKSAAWIDLLLLANYHPGFFEVRGIGVNVDRGQLAYSQQTLAQRWRWSSNRVKRFLFDLKMNKQIEYQNNNVTTLITITNYDRFQKVNKQTNRQTETKRKPNELHTKKDIKKNKDIVKVEKFYEDQLSDESNKSLPHFGDYQKFVDFIFGRLDKIQNKPLENILQLPDQMKAVEFEEIMKLYQTSTRKGKISDLLFDLENNPKYTKGRKSLYLILRKWLQMEFDKR